MKSAELRIGNLIDRVDYICRVIRIDEDGIITEPINYEGEKFVHQEIKPIPITKEWLLKFGFTQIDNCTYEIEMDGHVIEFDLRHRKMSVYFGDILLELKYVHELQNLYFALTSEELTIKE